MTEKQLKDWMERFFDAELTVDEERELYRYLCANEVSAELRKDREVILALCSTAEEDIELPEGAVERLEAMIDGLEEMKTHLNPPYKGGLEAPHHRHFLPPRKEWSAFLFRAACVVGVAVALFLVLPEGKDKPLLAEVYEEEDTFDNPEEAMQCLMAAYEDIMFAMNTARDNTREVHQALTQSVMTNLNLLKLEPTKNREL
jgi:hypothetical protein